MKRVGVRESDVAAALAAAGITIVAVPEQEDAEYQNFSLSPVRIRLRNQQVYSMLREGNSSFAVAYKSHIRHNHLLFRKTWDFYKDSQPLFVAANVTGALSVKDIMRHKGTLHWNCFKFAVGLAGDCLLLPFARDMAGDAVERIIELMDEIAPQPSKVVPIRCS